jgi:hypothetical protein
MGNIAYPTISVAGVNHGGDRPQTRAIVIHATRGNGATPAEEYAGSVRYCTGSNARQSGPNLMVGPSSVTRFCDDDTEAWHATVDNHWTYGIEVTQSRRLEAFSPWMIETTAELAALVCLKYGIATTHPLTRLGAGETPYGILGHEDLYSGYSRRKTDPGAWWRWDPFITLVRAHVRNVIGEPPDVLGDYPSVSQPLREYAQLHPELGGINIRAREPHYVDRDGDEVLKMASGVWLVYRRYVDRVTVASWA